jgi:hypothetical protein
MVVCAGASLIDGVVGVSLAGGLCCWADACWWLLAAGHCRLMVTVDCREKLGLVDQGAAGDKRGGPPATPGPLAKKPKVRLGEVSME